MATSNLSSYKPIDIETSELSVAIVVSEWNDFATFSMRDAAVGTLVREGVREENIRIFYVPGAFELTFASAKLCRSGSCDVVIAIGCVIRGETAHFDYVCSSVTQGLSLCNAEAGTPVIFCVLTDDSKQQSIDRSGGRLGNKGVEAAVAALKMVDFSKKLSSN